jgi:transposase-like protein
MKTHQAVPDCKGFFRKLLKGLKDVPRVIIPDKLKRYGAAKRESVPGVEHRQHTRLIAAPFPFDGSL